MSKGRGGGAAQVPLGVAVPVLDAIGHLSRVRHFALHEVLLAAFELLLARYSGETMVAVALGGTAAAVSLGGTAAAVSLGGAAAAALADDPTFWEVVGRVQAGLVGAGGHPIGSLERLQDFVGPRRPAGHGPFHPYVLVVGGGDDPEMGFDLKLRVDAARGRIEYDPQLFRPGTVAGMAGSLCRLLDEVAVDGDRPISRLLAVGDAERGRLVDDWNETALDMPPCAVHELVGEQVARFPDAPAVGDGGGWLTYRELDRRANQVAHHLRGLGAGRESLVGLCVTRTTAMVVAMLGVLKAGAAYVPLDPGYPAERLAFMLADAGVPILITESALLSRLPAYGGHVVCLDRDAAVLATEPEGDPTAGAGPGDLAYVIYTSGSTGRPKGVMIEHGSVVNLVSWAQRAFTVGELARVLASTSMCFDLSVFEIFVPLAAGTSLYVAPDLLDPGWAAVAPTLVNTVPSVLAAMLADRHLPDSVVTVNLAGEALGRDLVRTTLARSRATRVLNLYGPSEATVYCTAEVVDGEAADGERVAIGRPVANTAIHLLDPGGELVPIGAVGELHIGGSGLARGYLNRPELTVQRFVQHPLRWGGRLYRTGDLARYRPDGTIDFLGRMDDQVKIRGFRIEPGEVEAALLADPAIAQAAVVAREDTPGQRRLVAYVVAAAGEARPSTSALRARLAMTMPDHMVPSAFVHLDGLPRTPNGKLDRRSLPAPGRRPGGSDPSPAAGNATEIALARIWADVLDLPDVGAEDDFFELGGHSLLAVEVVARAQQAFGRKLPLTLVLQAATVRALAAVLDAEDSGQVWRSVFPIRAGGARRPIFCLHGLAGDVTGYRHLLPYLGLDQPLYGIQSVGLDGEQRPYTRVEDMAAHYIEEIRAVQPDGPYLLAGICFGSLVAYEIAHQLTTLHDAEVALLALVDPTPLPTRTLSEQLSRRVAKFRRMPRADRPAFLMETAAILASGLHVMMWGLVVDRRLRAGRPVPRRVSAMEAVNIRATLAYAPPAYPGSIVLYRSEGLATSDDDLRGLAWASLSAAQIEVVDVPGASHEALFVEPYIRTVGEHLRASIDRALAGCSAG